MIMTDAKAPDQGLKLADDDRVHTAQCVEEGWWLLDWDVDCVHVGVPQGGELGAYNERALFSVSLALLPLTAMASVRRDR